MCQSTIYLKKADGEEEELMRDAILVVPREDGVLIQTFFEEPKVVDAEIETIDLLKHRVVLRSRR